MLGGDLWVLLLALLLDALIGDPPWLWRRLPHPVVLFGRLLSALERRLYRAEQKAEQQRLAGGLALALLLGAATAAGLLLEGLLDRLPLGRLGEAVAVSVLLAQRSLLEHVSAVARAFACGGLVEARRAVAAIVGRDPDSLEEAGVCRAAIESLAENLSDGVVAPALWYALLGLPGLLAYKALNTADSMIGHLTPRYRGFGWAAARLDDLANLPASRLAALLIALAALPFRARAALAAALRDAGRHRSPNAGWPEAAMAGALGLALAGPRRYGARVVEDAWMNAGGREAAAPEDIGSALALARRGLAFLWLATLIAALIFG